MKPKSSRPASIVRLVILAAVVASVLVGVFWQGSPPPVVQLMGHGPSRTEPVAATSAEVDRTLVAGVVTLVVVDSAMEPVSGAMLELLSGESRLPLRPLQTGDLGRIAIPSDLMKSEVVVRHPDYLDGLVPRDLAPGSTHQVVLDRGASLDLRAVDRARRPVSGVVVRCLQPDVHYSQSLWLREGVTDQDGRIILSGLPRERYSLEVDAKNHILLSVDVDNVLPAQGTIWLGSAFVALARSSCALDSQTWRLPVDMLLREMSPAGSVQFMAAKMQSEIRAKHRDCIVSVICPPEGAMQEGDSLAVKFLARGRWGSARVPFRPYAPDMKPDVFDIDDDSAPSGQLVRVTLLDPDGNPLVAGGPPLMLRPLNSSENAHPIEYRGAGSPLRLPVGKYAWESSLAHVRQAIPADPLTISKDDPTDAIKETAVRMEMHIAPTTFQVSVSMLPGNGPLVVPGSNWINSGRIWAKNERGAVDAVMTTANLWKQQMWLCEGQNTVRLADSAGLSREVNVLIARSIAYLVDQRGELRPR